MMSEVTKHAEVRTAEKVSLFYIFWVFLKLGATAFGGYMSLYRNSWLILTRN